MTTPSKALVRGIPSSFAKATTQVPATEPIHVDLAIAQHQTYVHTLKHLGLDVIELPPLASFPDCCFVEDCVVYANGAALLSVPGTPTRRGEQEAVAEVLHNHVYVERMALPAMLDGGDCLRIDQRIYVGRSARTNAEAVARVRAFFEQKGVEVIEVPVIGILHLKCVCSYLGKGKMLLADDTIPPSYFRDVDILRVPAEEAYAANTVAVGKTVLLAAGYPATKRIVENEGFEVVELAMSEIRKADGSLTCMSILF